MGKTIVSAKHCCSIKAILPLWQKTNQDTSPFLLYPESIPEDWKSKLELIGVPIAISPFHDMDEKTDKSKWTPDDVIRNGKHYKKPHYHVVYVAKNPVTADNCSVQD